MEFQGLPEPDRPVKFRRFFLPEVFWERSTPYLLGVGTLIGLLILKRFFPEFLIRFKPSFPKLFDGTLAFSSIMAGFASTLIGILFSIRETRTIKKLELTGSFGTLKLYLCEAAFCNIILSICCIAANCSFGYFPYGCSICGIIVMSLFVSAVSFVIRAINIMARLL